MCVATIPGAVRVVLGVPRVSSSLTQVEALRIKEVDISGWRSPPEKGNNEMIFGGCPGAPGFGGPGFGGFGEHGHGKDADGPGPGRGFGHGKRRRVLKRAAFATAAMLLDGPADAAQVVARVSEATGGAFTPPQEMAELAIGLLAGRGLVTVDNGVATLTELGTNLLAWRGISSETAHAFLARAAQFGDGFKIRKELGEFAGLARTIAWTGTDEQKQQLAQARTTILDAVREAKKALHRTLAES